MPSRHCSGRMVKSLLILTTFVCASVLIYTTTVTKEKDLRQIDISNPDLAPLQMPKMFDGPLNDSYLMQPVQRTFKSTDISIIIVYTEGTPLDNYATALNSVECYAKLHSYPFHVFSDAKYKQCSKHKDKFFRRHCNIVKFMHDEMKSGRWLLVLDADIAVINPNRFIEDFVDPHYDITLFDRFFNFEIGANSYLVRNSELGRDFVHQFAEYEFKLPKSFHGTDNGALHPFLLHRLVPEDVRVTSLCMEIWEKSKNYGSLYEMEACTRLVFGDRINFSEHKLRILPKGRAWVRDLWLLKSRWADDDFMVHAVKEKQLDKNRTEQIDVKDSQVMQFDPTAGNLRTFPVMEKLDIAKCERGEERWLLDARLKISVEKKWKLLAQMETKILKKRLEKIGIIAKRL